MAARLIYVTNEEFDILSKCLKMGGPDCDSLNLDYKLVFMRDKFKEPEMPTKSLMTRVEAIDKIRNDVFGLTDTGQAIRWVDFFIAAGMLEIKEEKPKEVLFEQRASNGETVRLETWPEGLVLWVNGKIKHKYWEDINNS